MATVPPGIPQQHPQLAGLGAPTGTEKSFILQPRHELSTPGGTFCCPILGVKTWRAASPLSTDPRGIAGPGAMLKPPRCWGTDHPGQAGGTAEPPGSCPGSGPSLCPGGAAKPPSAARPAALDECERSSAAAADCELLLDSPVSNKG